MGNISYLFKKIVDTKGKFHTSVGTLKDKTGQDLTEVEEIKKRWKEYTEGLYKKKKKKKKKLLITQLAMMIWSLT